MWGSSYDETEQYWCVHCQDLIDYPHNCPNSPKTDKPQETKRLRIKSLRPDIDWKWHKWTFGFWHDYKNHTFFGIDVGPLEIVWRYDGYRP